jgi:hypothetical protein
VKTVQTAVRLPAEMRERLKASPVGVSEEIRRRIEQAFEREDKHDAQTRSLADDIMQLASLIRDQAKFEWHEHPEAHAALMGAVQLYLESRAPTSETAASPIKNKGFKPGLSENVGKAIATNFIHNRAAEQRKQQEIAELEARLAQLKGGKS